MSKISRRAWLCLAVSPFVIGHVVSGLALADSSALDLAEQISDEGGVTIKVRPVSPLPNAEVWRFEIQFDTHTMPLDQDLLKVVSLSAGSGEEQAPTVWDGDPPGGHHREGFLGFKPMKPLPASLTMTIKGIGGIAARSFTWKVSAP